LTFAVVAPVLVAAALNPMMIPVSSVENPVGSVIERAFAVPPAVVAAPIDDRN
jgi:hypothetical protein